MQCATVLSCSILKKSRNIFNLFYVCYCFGCTHECALGVQKVLPDVLQLKLTLTDGYELPWECYLLSFFSSPVMRPFKFTGANLLKVLDWHILSTLSHSKRLLLFWFVFWGFIYFCVCVASMYASVYICIVCMQCLLRPEEGVESFGPGVRDSWELPCGCW